MPTIFLTSASTSPWSQPGDWVEAGHTVRLIGAGGRGGTSLAGTTYRGGPGGGGGAHVLLTRTSGSLASTTAFHVGADNSSITDRTTEATCWGSASFTNCYYAEAGEGGGVGGTDFNGGLGGDATTTSVGTPTGPTYSASLNNSGGAGGTLTSPTVSGGGGGGAGGPSGVGGDGGATTTVSRGGSGGGAGNGGGSAAATSGVNGTAGAGAGGGAGGTTSTAAGDATGSAGSGGGGGFFSAIAAADTHGGAGGVNALDTQTSPSLTGGPGGGGGGGGSNSLNTPTPITSGGNGGNYGGGGGGAAGARSTTSTRVVGAGASGLIVVSYSLVSTETITVDAATVTLTGKTVGVIDVQLVGGASHLVAAFTPGSNQNNFNGGLGVKFTPIADVTYSQLGLRCATGNSGDHVVYLAEWASVGTRLRTATVNLTGASVGTFYYTNVTPITLTAGTEYFLATEVASGGQFWANQGATTIPGATAVFSAISFSFTTPSTNTAGNQFAGVDLGAGIIVTGKPITIITIGTELIPVLKADVSVAGQTVSVRDTSGIPVTQATVTFTGKTVTVRDLEFIPVLKASVVFTGKTVTILDLDVIPVLKATVLFTGKTITVQDGDVVPVAKATVLFTGKSVTIVDLVGPQIIPVGKADILLTGQNVVISTTGEQLPGGGGGVTVPPWRDLGRKKRRRYRALEEIEKRLDQRIERLESEAQEAQEQVAEVRLQVSTAQVVVVPDRYEELLRRQAQITQMLHEAQRRAETVRQERIELARLARIASEEADDEEAIAMLMRFL